MGKRKKKKNEIDEMFDELMIDDIDIKELDGKRCYFAILDVLGFSDLMRGC